MGKLSDTLQPQSFYAAMLRAGPGPYEARQSDQSALAQSMAGGGSRNYVVFDDKLVEILRRYGLLAPAGAGLGLAATGNNAEAGQ